MSVRFTYNQDHGLQIECEDGAELTEEQARIVVMRDMAAELGVFNHNFGSFAEDFMAKKFYAQD